MAYKLTLYRHTTIVVQCLYFIIQFLKTKIYETIKLANIFPKTKLLFSSDKCDKSFYTFGRFLFILPYYYAYYLRTFYYYLRI